MNQYFNIWSGAFLATKYNKALLGYQPCQVAERGKNQHFKDYLCPRPQGTDMAGDPVCHIYTCPCSVFMVAHWPMGTVGQGQVSALPEPAFWLDNMLVTGYQAWLDVKPLSLLKFSLFSRILITSLTQYIHPVVLSNTEILLKSIQCPVLTVLCYCRFLRLFKTCLVCSLCLASVDLPVWPMYTLLHSHGIQYMPGTFRPKSSLTGLSMYIFFLFGMWTMLMLYLAKSLVILLEMACWYCSIAIPIEFSLYDSGFCFRCRAHLISLLLYPFHWKMHFRCWISPPMLSGSQNVLACWTSVISTAHFCVGWCSDLAWR